MAALALEAHTQGGSLLVRQREHLRRALSTVGRAHHWGAMPGDRADRFAAAARDAAQLADMGAHAMERALAEELEEKRAEMPALRALTGSVRDLAADPDASFPATLEYSYTARDGLRRLVTRTETLTLADAGEAQSALARLEKRLDSFARLKDQMLEELEDRRRRVGEMRSGLPDFVASSRNLLGEVFATLV